ncbi:YdiU family protein [Colwelliaceae bacterium BS250]
MKFTNTYIQLGQAFYQNIAPTPVKKPELQLFNSSLALRLGLDNELLSNKHLLAQYFSGNELPPGAEPIALAYAGHQFGQFNPHLGDGRAHLLGELLDDQNIRYDIQLKGSGPTHFSRQGDGRCALGPAIREFIMSEAMHALGVPTSRCLAVVTTGEQVARNSYQPGAVVTRVATSHIRVGTFQFFAARSDLESLAALTDYAITRHFGDINLTDDDKVVKFLEHVIDKQIALVVSWLRVGFIHGVMNTDNTAISGETIDFGPCAMMGTYHKDTVFSSIDRNGRYAYGNQAKIAQWNMARLAEALLPLIDSEQDKAVALVEPLIHQFSEKFEQAYFAMYANKLGIEHYNDSDTELIVELLDIMQTKQLDYTQTFNQLTDSLTQADIKNSMATSLGDWYQTWLSRLQSLNSDMTQIQSLMRHSNPVVIPRNHHIENVLQQCEQSGDFSSAEKIIKVLASPYAVIAETANYQDAATDGDNSYQTFCGT